MLDIWQQAQLLQDLSVWYVSVDSREKLDSPGVSLEKENQKSSLNIFSSLCFNFYNFRGSCSIQAMKYSFYNNNYSCSYRTAKKAKPINFKLENIFCILLV